MNLDKIFSELGYSKKFKDICELKKEGCIHLSGYQLQSYTRLLERFNIPYLVLDIGYGFKIKLKGDL